MTEVVIFLILHIRILEHRKVAQGHAVSEWQSQHSSPGSHISEATVLAARLYGPCPIPMHTNLDASLFDIKALTFFTVRCGCQKIYENSKIINLSLPVG